MLSSAPWGGGAQAVLPVPVPCYSWDSQLGLWRSDQGCPGFVVFNVTAKKPLKLIFFFLPNYLLNDTFSFVIKEIQPSPESSHLNTTCAILVYALLWFPKYVQLTFEDVFELCESTHSCILIFFLNTHSWPSVDPGFPSADAEGWLSEGLGHPRILVTSGVLEPSPMDTKRQM